MKKLNSARYPKSQIMDSNQFKQALVNLKKEIQVANEEREYIAWKAKVDTAITKINAKIRATN